MDGSFQGQFEPLMHYTLVTGAGEHGLETFDRQWPPILAEGLCRLMRSGRRPRRSLTPEEITHGDYGAIVELLLAAGAHPPKHAMGSEAVREASGAPSADPILNFEKGLAVG